MGKPVLFCAVILLLLSCSIAFSQEELDQEHKSSFLYKKAKELGFDDYGWIAAMADYYKTGGERKLKKMLLLVDSDCGRYYRAVQRVGDFVIYRPNMNTTNSCGGREVVAVIPAKDIAVSKGKYIDDSCYYVFQEISNANMSDGFTSKIPVVKQVRKKK